MARLHVALIFLLVAVSAVIVSAVDKPSTTTAEAPASTTPTDGGVAEGPPDAIGTTDDDAAGTSEDDDVAVAGPIGSDSSYANYPPGPPQEASASSGSLTAFGFASVAAATAGSLFFF